MTLAESPFDACIVKHKYYFVTEITLNKLILNQLNMY